ncbi:MAG: hypothetical protein OHK0022_47340 [Roseiflexaceae bacterium]
MINASTQPTPELSRLTHWFGVGMIGILLDCALWCLGPGFTGLGLGRAYSGKR